MCEIFYAHAVEDKKELSFDDIFDLTTVAIESGRWNQDGFGAFNEDTEYKRATPFEEWDARELAEMFEGSEYFILHLRNATNGAINELNTHPFNCNNYVLVHNGILYWPYKYDESDSHQLAMEIGTSPAKTIEKKIQDSVKGAMGFLSVFLRDPKHNLYYFKENASMSFMHIPTDDIVYGATDEHRLTEIRNTSLLGFFPIQKNRIYTEPTENAIYQLGQKRIKVIGNFDLREYKSAAIYYHEGRRYDKYSDWVNARASVFTSTAVNNHDLLFKDNKKLVGDEVSDEVNIAKQMEEEWKKIHCGDEDVVVLERNLDKEWNEVVEDYARREQNNITLEIKRLPMIRED